MRRGRDRDRHSTAARREPGSLHTISTSKIDNSRFCSEGRREARHRCIVPASCRYIATLQVVCFARCTRHTGRRNIRFGSYEAVFRRPSSIRVKRRKESRVSRCRSSAAHWSSIAPQYGRSDLLHLRTAVRTRYVVKPGVSSFWLLAGQDHL